MTNLENYEQWIRNAPKCDLHCHAARGAGLTYLSQVAKRSLIESEQFISVSDMNRWYKNEIGKFFPGRIGYETLIKATISEAIRDNIRYIVMGFAIDRVVLYNNSVRAFIDSISNIINEYKEIVIVPELSVPKTIDYANNIVLGEEALELGLFKSIDIVGEELDVKFDNFVDLYRKAKRKGLRLRAHVGEFGTAYSVKRTCEILELDEVQHGIAAVTSNEVMCFLRDNCIQLNICPTSNVKMNIVSGYKEHPIRKLFDFGIKVTINTDDRAVFNRSASEEYIQLYKSGSLSVNQLEKIRKETLVNSELLWGRVM